MIQTSGIISMERERADHLHWSYNLSVNEYLTPKANKFKAYSKNTSDVTGIFITNIWHNSHIPVNFLLLTLNIAKPFLRGSCLFSNCTECDMT